MTIKHDLRNWRNYRSMLDIIRSIRRNPNARLGESSELEALSKDLQVSEELRDLFLDNWWSSELVYASMLANKRQLTADEHRLVEESLGQLETLIHAELKKLPADDEIVDVYLDYLDSIA